jgi:PEGA domain
MLTRFEIPRGVTPFRLRGAAKRASAGWLASSVLAGLAAILPSSAALAAEGSQPVQVLAVQSDDAVNQAQAVTLALKSSAKQQTSIQLIPGDYSLEVLSLALGCEDPPDDACLGKIATKVKADAFVWGSLTKDGAKLDLKLNLYRRGAPSRSTEIRYSASKADDDALKDIADRALNTLLSVKARASNDEAAEQTGKLLLGADDVDGQIIIDGAPAGDIQDGHAELDLPVGDHDVSVRADGYRDAEGTVSISASKRALLRLHLEKIGATHAAHEESEADATGAGSNASAGWGAIIVGGAFAVAGVYSTLRVNSINHDSDFASYRAGIPKDQDACVDANRELVVTGATPPDRISTLCSQSKTFEALQYVFFGLGAVAAGTGALILLTDDKAPPPKTDSSKGDALRATRQRTASIRPSLSFRSHAATIDLRLLF